MTLEFSPEPPPSRRRGVYDHAWIAAQLKANPDMWALCFSDVTPRMSTVIKTGGLVAYRDGKYEAITRSGSRRGLVDVYVRYRGAR